jgi:RNA polymerase-binding transcription factor DksA
MSRSSPAIRPETRWCCSPGSIRRSSNACSSRRVNAIAYLHDDRQRGADDTDEPATRNADNHLGDTAAITLEREVDEGLEAGAQQTLEQIDKALAKFDDGSFGLCERCGGAIGEERLRARPWATLCIDDQRLAGG